MSLGRTDWLGPGSFSPSSPQRGTSAIPSAMLTGCSSKQPQEKSLETGPAVFHHGSFLHQVGMESRHGSRQIEACFPVDMMIAASPEQGYLDKAYMSIQKMHVSICRHTRCASPAFWAPRALYDRSASVKDSSHHLGLSPLSQNHSLFIFPAFQ